VAPFIGERSMARTRNDVINGYLNEILSLEEHVDKAIKGQIEDFDEQQPEAARTLAQIESTIARHVVALKSLCDHRKASGSAVVEVVRRAGAVVAGVGAAAMDLIRNEKLPKDLRDDYAAINLAAIGYVMLHTTALALDDQEVAAVAKSHLADLARAVTTLTALIPSAVVQSLHDDGLPARDDVLPAVAQMIQSIWSGAELVRA
jgi:hypothetical protein